MTKIAIKAKSEKQRNYALDLWAQLQKADPRSGPGKVRAFLAGNYLREQLARFEGKAPADLLAHFEREVAALRDAMEAALEDAGFVIELVDNGGYALGCYLPRIGDGMTACEAVAAGGCNVVITRYLLDKLVE